MATPISPNTSVYLLKCPLELDNQHQLNFASRQAQQNYFMSLPKIEFDKFSYQRQDGVLRIGEHIDNLIEYNYVMYQNENYTDRWFYAYITGMEYVNDNCTFVSIKTDVIQTWLADLNFKKCFVEREHVNNDTFGLHTLEENFGSGEWFNNGTEEFNVGTPKDCFVAVLISELVGNLGNVFQNKVRIYNGIPSGCYLMLIDTRDTITSYRSLNDLIKYYDYYGKAEALVAMYLVPASIMGTEGTDYTEMSFSHTIDGYEYSIDCFIPNRSSGTKLVSTNTITKNSTLNGYTPKNNKCFTKQFNYLMITNNGGATANYYWEDFSGTPTFKLLATYQQGTPTKLVPTNYKGNDEPSGNAYAISGSPFPAVSWSSDYYLNWQAKQGWNGFKQRAEQLGKDFGTAQDNPFSYFGTLVQDVSMGVGAEISAITGTISGSMNQAERTPHQINGDPTNGDFTFSVNKCKFTCYRMSVRSEVAKVIDDYFSAYGYKVATWKVPNITGRRNWNFVKLNQVNVVADIPQIDLDEIKKIFLTGITFWHNPATFLDYSQNNSIV